MTINLNTFRIIRKLKPFSIVVFLMIVMSRFSFAEMSDIIEIDHPIGKRIVNIATNEKYDEALAILDSLINEHPDNPYGYLLRATTLSARTVDFENDMDLEEILKACDKVEEITPLFFENPDSSAQYHLYLGMASLYRSLVLMRHDQLLAMVKKLMQANKFLKLANEIDSTLWDVHYGLGMYQYQMSKRAGILRSIGIISDKREEGIEHIRTAKENGLLTVNAARNSLAWIEIQRGNYDESIRISRDNLTHYPGVRVFQWCLGKSLIYSEQWEESIPVFEQLLTSIRSEKNNNFYNEIDCLHKLTRANLGLERWETAIKYSDLALSLSPSQKVKEKKNKDLKQIMKMRKKAISQFREVNNE